ncbi:hypothetical protein IGB42_03863 [Andreprevotia sp. IGB-42]|uniref:phytanoyl-CoA dioxygenase family protein n=1 Tax=Andreprevotia sp. IGB-42 TaxID=2497473 RepID=UPI00135964A4|nr:phytanoyl-CoA dioxygenase family protein [Andreprevotia sp. IGB-42]KAF0811704.1 hypothetical protein IGB42_03863 [Andreprevotia sp. IGB-42]
MLSIFKSMRQRREETPVVKTRIADHLSLVSAGNPADFGGIIRIEIKVAAEALAGSQLMAQTANAAGNEIKLGPVEPGDQVSVGVHFLLLPNGAQRVVFCLQETDGTLSTLETTLQINNAGSLAVETAALLKEHGTPIFFVGPCDSTAYPYPTHTAWFDRPDAAQHIDGLLATGQISALEARNLHHFVEQGYVAIEGLLDDELVASVNAEIDDAVAKGYQGYKPGTSQRLEHLHLHYPNMRKLWLDQRHRRYADLIFGVQSRPCQTLAYVFGSQQDAHQDTIHLTPFPAGYMCGTWIALQDVVADSGELVVYPRSHRERRVYLNDTGCAKVKGDWKEFGNKVCANWAEIAARYEKFVYRPKKGTVLIWHENLLHEGSVRIDASLERRSVVIHSFADGAVVYYDSTGLNGTAVTRDELAEPR